MAATDAGLSSLALSTYSTSTYYSTFFGASINTGTNLLTPYSASLILTADFTIECWIYPLATGGMIINLGGGTGIAFASYELVWNGVQINFAASSTNTGYDIGSETTATGTIGTPILNAWNHIAVTRQGNIYRGFLNGVQGYTQTLALTPYNTVTRGLSIGSNYTTTWGTASPTNSIAGYMSNLRILKGTALYTANFTPPNTQLTAITNTSILTCQTNGVNGLVDNSTNNLTLTRNGNVGYKQFTPTLQVNASVTLTPSFTTGTRTYTFNAPSNVTAITVTPTAVDPALATIKYNGNVTLTSGQSNIASETPFLNSGGHSARFTAGLLQYANSPAINVQGYSWTADMWVYPTGSYPNPSNLFTKRVSGSNASAFYGYLGSTNGFIGFATAGTSYPSTFILTPNTWSHVAYTYDGAAVSIYVNGNRVFNLAIAITDNTEPLTIGGSRGTTEWMIGNISNFRFVKGYVIYTQTFTPPSQPLGLTQSSRTGVRAIVNNPANGSSGFFTGTSFLSVADNPSIELGSSDFTLEGWFYLTIGQTSWNLFQKTSSYELKVDASRWVWQINAATNVIFLPYTVVAGEWYHVAVVRNGTVTTLYVNGTSVASGTSVNANDNTNALRIGSGSSNTTGYISNVRLIKGTALYTSNFLVPLTPLTAITNTSLLVLQSSLTTDASTNNFTLTNTGVTLSTGLNPFSVNSASNQFLNTSLAYQVVRNPYNPALSLGQGHNNFTAEAWVYLTAMPPAAPGWFLIQKGAGTGPGVEWSFGITSTAMYFQTQTGIPYATITSTSSNTVNMTVGQWNHFAITKVGTSVHFWFDGIYSGTVNGVNNLHYIANNLGITIANNSNGTAGAFAGFISDARVVYGKAVYTADVNAGFIPNTTALTAIQSATATTASIDNASSYVVTNGNSVYFNNSNDFLTFPEPTASTGGVTIEAWVLLNAAPTTRGWIVNNSATSTGYFGVAITAARTVTVFSDSNVTAVLTSTDLIPLYTWTHIAVVFSNGNIYMYIDGVRDINTVVKLTVWGAATPGTMHVGRQASAAAQYFPGYITNLRMVYGTAVYTSKFTVPINPLTAITNTVFLGLQSTVTKDNGPNNLTITQGAGSTGLLLAPMTSPFSTYLPSVIDGESIAFGWGTSSPSEILTLTTGYGTALYLAGDFTVESWIYMAAVPATYASVIDTRSATTDAFAFGIWNSTGLKLDFYYGSAGRLTGTTILAINTWYHVAATRQGGLLRLWINGIQEASVTFTTAFVGTAAITARIGSIMDPSYWSGYLSNIRLIIGTAIYTGTFTPSITPYPLTTGASTNTLAVNGITTYPAVNNPIGVSYSGSIYNSPSGVVTIPNSARYELSTFDFTIEGWFNCNGVSGTHTIMAPGNSPGGGRAWILYVLKVTASTGYLYFESLAGKATSTTSISVSTGVITININQWYHLAAVRIGDVITLYLNGSAAVAQTISNNAYYMLGVSTLPFTIGSETGTTNNFNGYLSNLRVIRGYGIYTGTFTPSTTALTNTQASGTNIIALGNSIPALGNSVFFNGTTDYMKASPLITTMGTGNFTIETYYFPTSFATTQTLLSQYLATTGLGYWMLRVSTTGFVTVHYDGATTLTANTAILINEWVHIALVRISGVITLYVNGTSYGTVSFAGQYGTSDITYQLHIGALQSGVSFGTPTLGYFSNMRIVKGVGVYTGAFTVPTSPLTATQSAGTNIAAITGVSTSLLLFQDSPFTDNSTFNNAITGFGNPQYSPIFSPSFFTYPTPVNGNSGYFNGTTGFLSLTQPSNAGTGDFTIELWVYPTALAATNYLLSTSTNAANCYHLWITSTGLVSLAVDSATATISSDTQMFAKVGAWTHIAITRTSGIVYMYINGIRQLTTLTKASQFGDTGVLNIGRNLPGVNQFFTGYITNVRFVYGTPAVYVGNPYPTPPFTSPLTAITNTTLLLLQSTLTKDNSTNNVTVTTNTGVILSRYTNPYTMMKMPVLLAGQNSRDLTSTTGFRDNSMYNATLTSNALTFVSHQNTVSPFGVTPTLLLSQSTLNRDNSINNYILTASGTQTVIMPYVTPFSGQAIAFNGTSQYITGTSLYNSLGGDFTIEFFMMAGPQTSAIGSVLLCRNAAYSPATTNNYYIMCEHTIFPQQTIMIHKVNLGGFFVGATPVCDSKWHHIALVRINNIVKIYVDGVLDPSAQNSFVNSDVWDYSNYTIGSNPSDGVSTVAQLAYNGMLSNLRIINGTGIYTGTFTPPTNTLTTSQTSRTNVAAYTPTRPASAGNSLQFNGTTNTHVVIDPSPGLSFYLNDYTIEFWHYLTGRPTGSTSPCLFSNYDALGLPSELSMIAGHSSNITKYRILFGFDGSYPVHFSNTDVIYGKWTHIALVRKSGLAYLYINGVLDSISSLANYNVVSTTTNGRRWYIGAEGAALTTTYISGFISNFRVVNGIAVYSGSNTSVANFTVPTSPLTTTQSSGTNIAAISNSIVNNGGAIYFEVSRNAYQTIPTAILSPGTYDWTVEGWIFLNAMPTTDTWAAGSVSFFGSDSVNAADGTHCVIGQTQMFVAVTNIKYGTVNHGMSIYNWYHIAYVKINNTVNFYVNGVRLGSVPNVPTNGTATTSYIGTAAGSASYTMNGYISNLRVVKYLGIYTSTFPVLTSPLALTQNAVTTVNEITGTSTGLLALQNSTTSDASSNNFTLTAVGSPVISTSVYPSFNTSFGAQFNGVSQYITAPNNSLYQLTTAFTAEAWVYPLAFDASAQGAGIMGYHFIAGAGNGGWVLSLSQTNKLVLSTYADSQAGTTAGAGLTSTLNVPFNTWTHVAFTVSGTTATLYVNGVSSGSATLGAVVYGGAVFIIGRWNYGIPRYFSGTIGSVRVNNSLLYSGNFTVPTAPITAITNTQLLVLQSSLTTDASTNNASLTNFNSVTSGIISPYQVAVTNGSSVYFTGSSQYITAPSDEVFTFGTDDFTIEGWIYLASDTNTGTLYDARTGATTVSAQIYVASRIVNYAVAGVSVITGATLNTTTWYHIAVVRISGVTKLYINGTQSGNSYTDTNDYVIGSPYVGTGYSYAYPLTGYISNLRVVNSVGVYANVFIVPATPLTSIQNSITPVIELSSPSANGNSVSLNGTSQYLTVPQSTTASWQFGTSDFTVEFWIRTTDTDGHIIAPLNDNGSGNVGYWHLQLSSSNLFWRSAYNATILLTISTPSIIDGIWHHIAVVRISGTTSIYIDGVIAGSAADTTNYTFVNSGLQIGSDSVRSPGGVAATKFLSGLLSNMRIVKGVGVYTGNFALPVTPLTSTQTAGTNINAITGTSTQLLAIQSSLTTDASTNNTTLTSVDNPTLRAIGPFTTSATAANGYSVRFNGSTQYISIPISSVFNFTGDFTIEAWINMPVTTGGPYSIFGMFLSANWFDFRYFNNNFQVSLNAGSGTNIGGTMTANTWTHVALVRIGSSIRCYVGGVATGTTLTTSATLGFPSVAATIGRSGTTNYFNGYISNFRIVMGVGVYSGNFTPSTTPLTATQSAGTNIAAITGTSTAVLALQNSLTTDGSTNNFTLTPTASPVLNTGSAQSPFNVSVTNSGVVLLTAQSGITTDSAIGYPITNTNGLYQNAITPFGIQVPVTLLTAQNNIANVDNSTANITSYINATGANVRVSTVYGPFNSDASLLTLQGSLITDYSNNRAQVTVVGGGVAPTDASPFTPSKSLTSLLVPYGYVDTSYANAVIANSINTAQTNLAFNPYSIPSSLVSVLGLQTTNTLLESSINNSTFTTVGTAPTSNTSSPFGTYPTNGLITLNTSATTGIVGNVVNYANILVTAGDAVTTNAYSIVINTSLVVNIGNRDSVDAGILSAQSNTTFTISDVANSNISEATILTFANTSITPIMNIVDYGFSVSPSNITFIITDVANSNLSETLYDIFVSNVQSIIIPTDQGLTNVSPSNVNFFITDVANSNISETIANVVISNVSTTRSITDTGTAPPSPVGGTVLFPTYAYTDGITIVAENVESGGGGGGSFASNQQIWYQT